METNHTRCWQFGPFEADAHEQRLWRNGEVVPLTRKSFTLLTALLGRPAKLFTKAELFSTVWAGTVVTDGALSRAIRELRVALGDDAAAPRYIETAHGLGFRFVAPVRATAAAAPTTLVREAAAPFVDPQAPSNGLFGREAELQWLDAALAAARSGQRQLVFVTGEPGIGKTALVDAFISRHAAGGGLWAAQGRCVEQYGTREAYLPVLEALERLAGQVGAERLRQTLVRYAPAWLAQLPWLAHDADPEALRRALAGATARRMLRELAQALEVLAAERPIVLWLEDLHWSDYSSLAALTFLAGRRDAARLLLIGSYRPADVLAAEHPLRGLTQDLALHGQSQRLPLERLSAAAVAEYLRARFGHLPELAEFIHRRTDGNPLFTVAMADNLVRRGDLIHERLEGDPQSAGATPTPDGWRLRWPVAELGTDMPDNLRRLIHSQFERLGDDERRLLEAAAVAGTEFSAAAVAAALQGDTAEVEERCASLVHSGRFLRSRPAVSWPDGTLAGGFGFLHALYWQALYDQVPQSRRAQWQRRIGLREEQAYGAQTAHIATALAMRFEAGRDPLRSLHYLKLAASGALARCAYRECIDLLRHALGLVPQQPAEQQQRRELDLLLPLGAALMAAQGYASDEVAATYRRALSLCRVCAEPGELNRTLRGLWNVALVRADLAQAHQLAGELLTRANANTDASTRPSQIFDAYAKLGQTCMHSGEFAAARQHLEHALSLPLSADDPLPQRESPRVAGYLAWVLWYTGHPAQALVRADEALALARRAASPHTSAFTLGFISFLHLFRGEIAQAQDLAQQQEVLSVEHALPYWSAWSGFTLGLVASLQGQPGRGLVAMVDAIAAFGAMGAEVGVAHFHCLHAQACIAAGELTAARGALNLSAALVARNGNGYMAAEALRLRGELALVEDPTPAGHGAAAEHFARALSLARQQGARALELRAGVSLARLWADQGQRQRGVELLAPLCTAFTEGADTADLRDARALWRDLQRGSAETMP